MKYRNGEKGQALIMAMIALVLGAFLVTPFLGLISTNLTGSQHYRENMQAVYACDAGVEYGIWELQQGMTTVPSFMINGYAVAVSIATVSDGLYDITSTATGVDGSTTVVARVSSGDSSGEGVFSYAVVTTAGDITLSGDARIYSDNYPVLDSPVFAHGNVVLNNNSIVEGDVYTTGSVTTAPGAAINGTSNPEQAPITDLAVQVAQLDTMVSGRQAETMTHGCAAIDWGPSTSKEKTYQPTAGTYPDQVNAQRNMTLSTWGGIWVFQDTVCAGMLHSQKGDLTIGGGAMVTVDGSVGVGNNLIINGWGTTVTFNSTLCVEGNLVISQGATVVIHGSVYVAGNINTSDWSGSVTFHDTVYAGGDVSLIHGKDIYLGGKMYSGGSLTVDNAVDVTGGQYIVTDGNILVQGDATFNNDVVSAAAVPFLVSTGGSVTLAGGSRSTALVYAPSGEVLLGGYSSASLRGAVFARSFRTTNWSGKAVLYPVGLRTRSDLPGGGTSGGEGDIVVLSWNVSSN